MRRLILGGLLLWAVEVAAQTAIPTSKFAWDQGAATLAEAQAYTYRSYSDGAATGVVLSAVVCTGTASPFVCTVPVPAYTPGTHTVAFTAANLAGESAKSTTLSFTMVIQPSAPTNPRIQ